MKENYLWMKFSYIATSILVITSFLECCFSYRKGTLDWEDVAGVVTFLMLRHSSKQYLKRIDEETNQEK